MLRKALHFNSPCLGEFRSGTFSVNSTQPLTVLNNKAQFLLYDFELKFLWPRPWVLFKTPALLFHFFLNSPDPTYLVASNMI